MSRGRRKKRGYHQRGYKLDGFHTSEDLCPYCYSFGCDPMSMSPQFQIKIRERLRKKLCPCCGEPIDHCKCKSSEKIPAGIHTVRTHNNKKRRKALLLVRAKESAWHFWEKHPEFSELFSDDDYQAILFALYHHDVPKVSWAAVQNALAKTGVDITILKSAWTC